MTVLSLALKGALLLSLAGAAVHLLRRAPAASRHAVWVAAFVGLLTLPMYALLGPSLQLPVLPEAFAQRAEVAPPPPAAPVAPVAPAAPAAPFAPLAPVGAPMWEEFETPLPAPAAPAAPEAPAAPAAPPEPAIAPLPPKASWFSGWIAAGSFGRNLASAWAGVAFLVLLGWMLPLVAAWHLVRRARPETSGPWLDALEHARLLSDVEGPVRLLRSDRLDVPVAWGWGTPAVVLPASADAWDDDRRQAVLLHELAHIARGDAQTQVLAQLAVSLHWFDPLAWWAYRRMLEEREHACDDAVLRGGARPSTYAGHLVDIARGLRRRPRCLTAFAPMARSSELEGRVRSILGDEKRAALTRLRAAGVGLVAFSLVLPLAACQLTSRTSRAPEPVVAPSPRTAPQPAVARAMEEAERQLAEAERDLADAELDLADAERSLEDIEMDLDVELAPALEAARRSLAEARIQHDGLADVDWDELEREIQSALAEAHAGMEEAIAEARAELADAEWEAEIEASLRQAQRDRTRALADMRRELAQIERDVQREVQQAEREAAHERRRELEDARREVEQAQREAARERERATEAKRRELERQRREATRVRQEARSGDYRGPSTPPESYSYAIATANGNAVVIAGNGRTAWSSGLNGWRAGLSAVASQVARASSSSEVVALQHALDGMEDGLDGIEEAASAWARSGTDRRAVREGIANARRALATVRTSAESASTCDD